MKKNDPKKVKKSELISEDADIVERVKEMMEPEPKKTDMDAPLPEEPTTAPEVTDLPLPKEPLKIKILRDNEPEEPDEIQSAPVLLDESAQSEESIARVELATNDDNSPTSSADESTTNEDFDDDKEDSITSDAVDDIVRHESDELLKAEDEKLSDAFKPVAPKTLSHRLKATLLDIWQNPKKRMVFLSILLLTSVIIGTVPVSRYFVLNTVGVRASTNITVLDKSTLQPLKNVEVTVQGVNSRTNDDGFVRLDGVKLGSAKLKIERRAFATVERQVTIGWGSNPQGEERLQPTGTQYAFLLTDYLSGKAVEKAEVINDDASAFSDEKGKVLLTIENPADELKITITSEGRRVEDFSMSGDFKGERKVHMVPARKHTYISRRDQGRYDVYAAYVDGRDETLILEGTGNEREDMVLVPHPTEGLVAIVSTREGKHNEDGYLLSSLLIVDENTKKSKVVQTSERIQLTGWFGDRLVYVRVVSGASASNPKRNRLMAYHYKDETNNELAASNYFNDVMAIGDRVYFAPSGAYLPEGSRGMYSIKPDGTDKKTVLDKEVWNMFQTNYGRLALAAPNAWYRYDVKNGKISQLSGEPAGLGSKVFVDSPDGKQSSWVEVRDGKGTLLIHDVKDDKDKTVRVQSGLRNPIRWLDNETIVYRVKTDLESADYAMSLTGGEPKKIADVTNTDGIDRWYYY
ncbi:hypothetical protein KC968_03665 [Candidatus Saccharibacteria bacterium]|nr:hypothetical protein [Candidatus Saccharibacteria bacterium]